MPPLVQIMYNNTIPCFVDDTEISLSVDDGPNSQLTP